MGPEAEADATRGEGVDGPHVLTVSVAGWRVKALSCGRGRPIVLVHGLGTSSASWRCNLEALARCGRVYAVDLPGFGDSDTPDRVLSTAELAEVLRRWCDGMGIRKARFIGHSYGGELCLYLAAHHPELVERLVLAGATGSAPGRGLLWRVAALARDAVREPLRFMPVLLKAYMKAGPVRMFKTAKGCDMGELTALMRRVTAPALVVRGAQDPLVTQRDARRMAGLLPNSELTVIRNGAHGIIFDAPEVFNRVVCDFLMREAPREKSRASEDARPTEVG